MAHSSNTIQQHLSAFQLPLRSKYTAERYIDFTPVPRNLQTRCFSIESKVQPRVPGAGTCVFCTTRRYPTTRLMQRTRHWQQTWLLHIGTVPVWRSLSTKYNPIFGTFQALWQCSSTSTIVQSPCSQRGIIFPTKTFQEADVLPPVGPLADLSFFVLLLPPIVLLNCPSSTQADI